MIESLAKIVIMYFSIQISCTECVSFKMLIT